MKLGEIIKEARLRKGYSQDELAKLLGYKSRSSVNKIEVGERDIPSSIIYKITKILDISLVDLFFEDINKFLLEEKENEENSSIKFLLSMNDEERKTAYEFAIEDMMNNIDFQHKELLEIFDSLNEDGKMQVLQYTSDLASNDKYRK